MKDLSVKFWDKRGHWVINANRVGLDTKHGNFASKAEALAEAERLKAQFVLGHDVEAKEKPKLFSVAEAIEQYESNQALLQTKSYHDAQKFNLGLLAAVKFDGLSVGKHQMERLGRKVRDTSDWMRLTVRIQSRSPMV